MWALASLYGSSLFLDSSQVKSLPQSWFYLKLRGIKFDQLKKKIKLN